MAQDNKRKFFRLLRRFTQVLVPMAALLGVIAFFMDHWKEIMAWLSP